MDAENSFAYDISAVTNGLNKESQGDALIERLREHMSLHFTVKGWSIPGASQPEPASDQPPLFIHGWRLVSDSEESELVLPFNEDKSIRALVLRTSPASTYNDLEPWLSALASAVDDVRAPDPMHAWRSVVGQDGLIGNVARIEDPFQIGSTTITPSKSPYTEYVENRRRPSLSGGSALTIFPLAVRGESAGHQWESIESQAIEETTENLCSSFTSVQRVLADTRMALSR